MKAKLLKYVFFFFGMTTIILLNSCTYDNIEDLYPQPPTCDTLNVTFAQDVLTVIDANCTVCHSGSAPSGNLSLTNYADIVVAAQNGSLIGVINHRSGWSPMPKNGAKLDECTIKKIEAWVAAGTPNN
ncbi:MAG: hypothetical protein HQ521_11455 [Bacteroidetes bacterium]|nr:hypothetical protein [Bacteroidota bacterium]